MSARVPTIRKCICVLRILFSIKFWRSKTCFNHCAMAPLCANREIFMAKFVEQQERTTIKLLTSSANAIVVCLAWYHSHFFLCIRDKGANHGGTDPNSWTDPNVFIGRGSARLINYVWSWSVKLTDCHTKQRLYAEFCWLVKLEYYHYASISELMVDLLMNLLWFSLRRLSTFQTLGLFQKQVGQ